MSVRYVIIDQDFFFLVEPDFSKTGEYNVKVHIKQPLKMVESMIDRTEPRNLIVGLVILQKGEEKVSNLSRFTIQPMSEEMLLFFENTHKCSLVKNKLDLTKKTSKQVLITKAASYLEKCLQEIIQPVSTEMQFNE